MAVIQDRGPRQYRALVRKLGFPSFSRTFERQRDAQAWATDVESAIGKRDLAEVRRLTSKGRAELNTVADLVDKYVKDIVERPGRRPGQVATEKPRLARIRAELGRLTVEMLDVSDVTAWRDQRLNKDGAAPQTVRHDISQLSKVLATAIEEWHVPGVRNVVNDVTKPKLPDGRNRRVTQAEIDCIYSAAAPNPHQGGRPTNRGVGPIVTLAVESAMRLGEMLSLEWRHIELEERLAFLPKTKNKEQRTVPLSSTAVLALKAMHSDLRRDGRVFDWAASDSFEGPFATVVARARLLYEEACAKNGTSPSDHFLADFRFHDLRHEATSRLFEQGLNAIEVATITGHKTMQMLKRYSHLEARKLVPKLR